MCLSGLSKAARPRRDRDSLQRIITFRRMAEAKEKQARRDRRQIGKLDRAVLKQGEFDLTDRVRHAEALREEVRALEQDVIDLHDAIAEQVNAMEPDQMLWL